MPKTSEHKKIVIAGAGMTGMMCALKLRENHPNAPIVIFDKSEQIGGMYGSISYKEGHIFDYGMHVIYESCNADIDDLYRKIMPAEDWHIYEGNEKDIAGLFFNGKLQEFSHYVDLRSFSKEKQQHYIGNFFINLNQNHKNDSKEAMEYLRNRFGQDIVNDIHKKILFDLYKIEPESIDVFAIKATALDRIIMFDKEIMTDLMKSDLIRARVAFPDQLSLPPYRTNTQKALYPKKFGMRYFFNRFNSMLIDKNIEILTGADLQKLDRDKSGVTQITLSNYEKTNCKIPVATLIWTAGWPSLASCLNVNISDMKMMKGPRIIYVNLVLDRPPTMGRLYYFYCYDNGYGSFRITNYSNYCPDACLNGNYPICVEFWPSRIGLDPDTASEDFLINTSIDEIKKIGIISNHNVLFARAENLKSEFPMPSAVNIQSLHEIRSRIDQEKINNLIVSGVMAEDGLFFLPDILNDAFRKISSI